MANLKKWLTEQKLFKRTEKVKIPSHLLYDGYNGGKIYVPREREHEFLYHYSEEMKAGSKLYYVETRPKTFKYMIDIDITDDHYWTNDEIINISKFIQNVVYDFYEKNQMTICATSPAKEKADGIHTGVHLIWPKLYVDSETAMILRRGIVQKLNENVSGPKEKSWEDIIDEVIYTRNGYRMVGSDKLSPKTKLPENRSLEIKFVMNSEGKLMEDYLDRLKNNFQSLAVETSIRYIHNKQYHLKGMEFKHYPKWLEPDALESVVGNKSKTPGVIVGNREHIIIEHFIRENLPKEYGSGSVKAVTRYDDGNLLIKTTSGHCMNIGRCHNSCGIFFFASPNGLYQKCLCPCDNLKGRKRGYCRDYTSDCFPFTDETRDLLFPQYSKKLFIESKKNKNNYRPLTTNQKDKELKEYCDKLFDDIFS